MTLENPRAAPLLKEGDIVERLKQFRLRWQESGDLTYLGKALTDAVVELESFGKRHIFYLDRMAWAKRDAAELEAISSAIGTVRFMDPPDGGDVSLAEQVRRMREALEKAEAALEAKPLKWRHVDVEQYEAISQFGLYEVCGNHWSFEPGLKRAGGELASLHQAENAAHDHHEKLYTSVFVGKMTGTSPDIADELRKCIRDCWSEDRAPSFHQIEMWLDHLVRLAKPPGGSQ